MDMIVLAGSMDPRRHSHCNIDLGVVQGQITLRLYGLQYSETVDIPIRETPTDFMYALAELQEGIPYYRQSEIGSGFFNTQILILPVDTSARDLRRFGSQAVDIIIVAPQEGPAGGRIYPVKTTMAAMATLLDVLKRVYPGVPKPDDLQEPVAALA
jgi:hypothetical protein